MPSGVAGLPRTPGQPSWTCKPDCNCRKSPSDWSAWTSPPSRGGSRWGRSASAAAGLRGVAAPAPGQGRAGPCPGGTDRRARSPISNRSCSPRSRTRPRRPGRAPSRFPANARPGRGIRPRSGSRRGAGVESRPENGVEDCGAAVTLDLHGGLARVGASREHVDGKCLVDRLSGGGVDHGAEKQAQRPRGSQRAPSPAVEDAAADGECLGSADADDADAATAAGGDGSIASVANAITMRMAC